MSFNLPYYPGLAKGIKNGRNPYEGYQRGMGLQFGDLRKEILNDSLYNEALHASGHRSVMSEENRMNIYLIMKFFLDKIPFGNIVEFGSYKGGSAIFMAYVAKNLFPGMKIFALDTFEGMPTTDNSIDAHGKGDFNNVDFDELQNYIKQIHLDNLVLVKGLFQDTQANVMKEAGKVSLAHIDCDIASAVEFSYECVKDYLVNGGYIVFDDGTVSSCMGATEAIENALIKRDQLNSEQIWPHFVFRRFETV
jgi:predicted O-methyltransferase YrrM